MESELERLGVRIRRLGHVALTSVTNAVNHVDLLLFILILAFTEAQE